MYRLLESRFRAYSFGLKGDGFEQERLLNNQIILFEPDFQPILGKSLSNSPYEIRKSVFLLGLNVWEKLKSIGLPCWWTSPYLCAYWFYFAICAPIFSLRLSISSLIAVSKNLPAHSSKTLVYCTDDLGRDALCSKNAYLVWLLGLSSEFGHLWRRLLDLVGCDC